VLLGLAAAMAVAGVSYWSRHLVHEAEEIRDWERKVGRLEKAGRLWAANHEAFFELGQIWFRVGRDQLDGDQALSRSFFRKAVGSFERSLRANPADAFTHFTLAQVLFAMDSLSPGMKNGRKRAMAEYKKAAQLAWQRTAILYEVGRVFLTRWKELSSEDKEFTLDILGKVFREADPEEFQGILRAWEMNVGDYALAERILPEDIPRLKAFASFLGERGLSPGERHKVLARVERLAFRKAREDFIRAENLFRNYRFKEAEKTYRVCLEELGKIRFYQELTGKSLIEQEEYVEMLKTVHLKLARCGIEEDRTLKDVEAEIRAYLEMVDRVADASELERTLVERGLLGDTLVASLNDLELLNLHTFLYFKQNRYRDIIRMGEMLLETVGIVPDEEKSDYAEVLCRVADSYQLLGYFYDSVETYRKALQVEEKNLGALLGLKRSHERLNNEQEVRRVDRRLRERLSPRRIYFDGITIQKGESLNQDLILSGKRIKVRFQFAELAEGDQVLPLVAVFFNGRVVWEDYLGREKSISVSLKTKTGKNRLEVAAVNRSVILDRLFLE